MNIIRSYNCAKQLYKQLDLLWKKSPEKGKTTTKQNKNMKSWHENKNMKSWKIFCSQINQKQ